MGKRNARNHKKLSLVETGLFVSCENPVLGPHMMDVLAVSVMNQEF